MRQALLRLVSNVDTIKWVVAGVLALATGIATIVGGVKAIDYLSEKMKGWRKRKTEQRDAWKNVVSMIEKMQEAQAEKDARQEKMLADIQKEISEHSHTLKQIVDKNDELSEQIGTVQSDRLNWAYDYFIVKRKPLPLYQRMSLERMYQQYTKGAKQNGVPHDFEKKISACVEG